MNQRQKLVQQQFLNNEEAVIKRLKQVYGQSLKDINAKIKDLQFKIDDLQLKYDWMDDDDPDKGKVKSMIQSKIYQKKYQEALQGQVDGILKEMKTKQFLTISDYLDTCYEEGFVGSIFDLHGQGVPLMIPLDQTKMVRAVQLESKISKGLYTRLGEDVDVLKKKITAQVSRSIATGVSYAQTAQQLAGYTNIGMNNAVRIARTEGHRIQTTAAMDVMESAKAKGADVVKQWDAALDDRTRESHQAVDGEIREVDEPFSNGLMFPGDPDGGAAEVVNCRCALLQRARWALDEDELQTLKDRAEYFGLDKADTFDDFKKKYLKAVDPKGDADRQAQIKARREAYKNRKLNSRQTIQSVTPDFDSMDRKQLDRYVAENLKTTFEDTTGVNVDFYRETAKVMTEFESKMGGTIDGLRIKFGGVRGNASAHYDSKTNTVHIKKTGSIEKFTERQRATNERAKRKLGMPYHATTTYSGTVWHELGHAVDYDMNQNLSRKLSRDSELFVSSVRISAYAGSAPGLGSPKRSEAWAENFAAYMDKGANAKDVPPEIIRMIEEYFKSKHN